MFGGSGIMFNKDDLIILVNEYVSAATINLDCIDVCESIVGQLVYLYECVKNQCHLDKVFMMKTVYHMRSCIENTVQLRNAVFFRCTNA